MPIMSTYRLALSQSSHDMEVWLRGEMYFAFLPRSGITPKFDQNIQFGFLSPKQCLSQDLNFFSKKGVIEIF